MLNKYLHKVQYYETDKMGITHHSNYIRWMEEARVNFLEELGYSYDRLEKEGIISPVVSVNCDYKKTSTFSDEITINVKIVEFKGIKLILEYEMRNQCDEIVCTANSTHCFLDMSGKPVRLNKEYPEFVEALNKAMEN